MKRYKLTDKVRTPPGGDMQLPMDALEKAPWAGGTMLAMAIQASAGNPGPHSLQDVVNMTTRGRVDAMFTPQRIEQELDALVELGVVEVILLN
jgi:hypothetical protein